jgi:hypothetical protein
MLRTIPLVGSESALSSIVRLGGGLRIRIVDIRLREAERGSKNRAGGPVQERASAIIAVAT